MTCVRYARAQRLRCPPVKWRRDWDLHLLGLLWWSEVNMAKGHNMASDAETMKTTLFGSYSKYIRWASPVSDCKLQRYVPSSKSLLILLEVWHHQGISVSWQDDSGSMTGWRVLGRGSGSRQLQLGQGPLPKSGGWAKTTQCTGTPSTSPPEGCCPKQGRLMITAQPLPSLLRTLKQVTFKLARRWGGVQEPPVPLSVNAEAFSPASSLPVTHLRQSLGHKEHHVGVA